MERLPDLGSKAERGVLAYDRIMDATMDDITEHVHARNNFMQFWDGDDLKTLQQNLQMLLRETPRRYHPPVDLPAAREIVKLLKKQSDRAKTWFDDIPDQYVMHMADLYAVFYRGRSFEVVPPPRFTTTLAIDKFTANDVDADDVYPLFNDYLITYLRQTYPEEIAKIEESVVLEKQMIREEAERRAQKKQTRDQLKSILSEKNRLPAFAPITPNPSKPSPPKSPLKAKSPPKSTPKLSPLPYATAVPHYGPIPVGTAVTNALPLAPLTGAIPEGMPTAMASVLPTRASPQKKKTSKKRATAQKTSQVPSASTIAASHGAAEGAEFGKRLAAATRRNQKTMSWKGRRYTLRR